MKSTDTDLLIAGGRVIDPVRNVDDVADLWIRGGIIGEVTGPWYPPAGRRGLVVFDAKGMVVCPGLVDLHCHLRDPGQEEKETIGTGTREVCEVLMYIMTKTNGTRIERSPVGKLPSRSNVRAAIAI